MDNQDYGIHVWSGANTLIEQNFFKATHVGVQLPKDSTVIRYNTFARCDIAVNVLMGARPLLANNIFTESTFSSIYEFSWDAYSKGQPSRGYLTAENNTFWKNTEKGTYYGSATPFSVEKLQAGNLKANPLFINPLTGDYTLQALSSSQGRGSFLPEALTSALDRASNFSIPTTIQNITDGTLLVGYRLLYEEGSVEEFYIDGRQVFDTTPPQIVTSKEPVFTNQSDYEWIYTVDGVEHRKMCRLNEGENVLTAEASDVFGNSSSKSMTVTLDRTPPSGALQVNGGDSETDALSVVLSVQGSDGSPLKDTRFSTDHGQTWTAWAPYVGQKVLVLSEGEGDKEVLCELRDVAGNSVLLSDTIRFLITPPTPEICFLSSSTSSDPRYLLRYTVDGVEKQETWRLHPGVNQLMVVVSQGAEPVFAEFSVTSDQTDGFFPSIPLASPSAPADLVSLTTQDGFVLGYSGGNLFSIEKPGEFSLHYLEFSAEDQLNGGVLFLANGDKIYYHEGSPLCCLRAGGEKIFYNEDGTVSCLTSLDNQKIHFAYRLDSAGQVKSVLSSEVGTTSLYDENGKPVRIKKDNGVEILYKEGFLSSYRDQAGDVFHYRVSSLSEGIQLTGYRAELESVTPAGSSGALPLETILASPIAFSGILAVLESEISRTTEYDVQGNIRKVVSIHGEALGLDDGMPISFTGQDGIFYDIESLVSGGQQFFALSSGNEPLEQVFGADGQLSDLRMADGTKLKLTAFKLDQIDLEDGSCLTQLVWDGNKLTGFVRNQPDGAQETYSGSRLILRRTAQGSVENFSFLTATGYPRSVTMPDGRIYDVSEVKKSEDFIERLMTLTSVMLPNGERLEFSNGSIRWVSPYKGVEINPVDVPQLLAGRFFVPLVQLTNAQLRDLTVDQNGTIFSGQILFNDGTQYLIEDQKIVKQITSFGQLIELEDGALPAIQPPAEIPVAPLTEEEIAFRDGLVETQLDYFVAGKGIHAGTGLPLDNYKGASGQQSTYSQSTLIGFWAEILSSIAVGDYETPKISRAEAFSKLEQLMTTYRQVQQQAGWNGMVAFFSIVEKKVPILDLLGNPTGQTQSVYEYKNCFNQVGFGDVLNLSVSLASVMGALADIDVEPSLATQRDHILQRAQEILADQEAGYAAFYDPVSKRFHGAYGLNGATGRWEFINNYYIDRAFNEFRTGMVWLVSKYPQYADALKNLDVAVRPFETDQRGV
ncbi:MAG: hypothetical protein PHG20_10715, partial [Geobacteraceae bacterium]|nr:hypothetical protein [Geobacteraceae bacterium]